MAGLESDPAVAGVQRDQSLAGPTLDRHPVPLRRGDDEPVPVRHPVVFERQINPFACNLLVRAAAFPHLRRVLVEVAVPGWFTVRRQKDGHRAFFDGRGSGDHDPFRRFESFAVGDALRVDRALFLDLGAGEIVPELPRALFQLDAAVGDPAIRCSTLARAPYSHPVGGQSGHVVVPRIRHGTGLAELDAQLVVVRVPPPVGVGALGEITRRRPVTAALGGLPARIDVLLVVVPEMLQDQLVGTPGAVTDRVDIFQRAVDGATGFVTPLSPVGHRQHRLAAARVGDDAVRMPLAGLPHAFTVGRLDPLPVISLGHQLGHVAGEFVLD